MQTFDDDLSHAYKVLEDWLQHGDWKPVSLETNLYLINHQSEFSIFPVYCKFSSDDYLLNFSGKYSYPVPDEKISTVLEYINHINYGVSLGNLELEDSTNEVCFRTSLLLYKIELTGQLINNLFHNCIRSMDRYMPGVCLIVERNLGVKEAYETVISQD